jgi:hypothetical protein
MSDKKNEYYLSQVHTSCKSCVFAKYENGEQVDCKLNKLQDYKNADIKIIDVIDEGNDGIDRFYVIDGRFCMFYRNEQVMSPYPRDTWETMTKLQTKVPYHAIVIVNENTSLRDIKTSLYSLKNQEIQPNFVTIVNKQYAKFAETKEGIAPSVMLETLQDQEFHKFSLKNIYDKEIDDRSLVDLVFDSSKQNPIPFFVVFEAEFDIPEKFSSEFNNAILIEMKQIGVVKPKDHINGFLFNKTSHNKHSGNAFGINLEDKIAKFEEDGEKFIFEIGDICPSMK